MIPTSSPDRRTAIAQILLAALLFALTIFLLANLIAFHYGRDQGVYAVVAAAMLEGKAPYRDAWDIKPPGILFVFALARALLGAGVHAVRLLEAACYASLVLAFALFSRRHIGSALAGIMGGALAVLGHVQLEFWSTAQPEGFGAVALAWALVCASYEPAGNDRRAARLQAAAWLGAGVLYGGAFLLKPPLGGGILISLAVIARRRSGPPAAPGLRAAGLVPALALGLGAALPVAGVVLYFIGMGAWRSLYETIFVFAPQYTAVGFHREPFVKFLLRALEGGLLGFSNFILPGIALLLALPAQHHREREGLAHLAGAAAFPLLGVALQGKFFAYHYGAALPLLALAAGWGFWKGWLAARRRFAASLALGALTLILLHAPGRAHLEGDLEGSFWRRCGLRVMAALDSSRRPEINDRLYSRGDLDAGANRQVAEWLRIHLPRGAPVFIWGFEPMIYDLAGMRPASRYIHNQPQRVAWDRERSRRVLMEDLRCSRPAAILVVRNDVFERIMGDSLDSAGALKSFPELLSLIREEYRLTETIHDFEIHLRREASPHGS